MKITAYPFGVHLQHATIHISRLFRREIVRVATAISCIDGGRIWTWQDGTRIDRLKHGARVIECIEEACRRSTTKELLHN